jgi:hypothetical protein
MGINSEKQATKLIKQAHQAAGHIEDANTDRERRDALMKRKKDNATAAREAAAQRHIEKAELEELKRKLKHK